MTDTLQSWTPLVTLAGVLALIAVRRVGSFRIGMWQSMFGGALVVVVTGSISFADAFRSIDFDILVFLFGMFVVGAALETSGYLAHLSYSVLKRTRSRNELLLALLFGSGFASAFLMNDTLAVIGVPVVLHLARKHVMSPLPLLLGLCFAVTIGSVCSPIGNPQNLLIAMSGVFSSPFVSFFGTLLLPTLINLLACYWLLRSMFPDDFHSAALAHSQEPVRDARLAQLARISLLSIIVLVAYKVIMVLVGSGDVRLTFIAVGASLPILIGSARRWEMVRRTDWKTIVFFASMFVLMQSVWNTGFFQDLIGRSEADLTAVGPLLLVSMLLSQIISNVPLVALLQPILIHGGAGEAELLVLAAGSTIAGNLFILGAASNVIILHGAEERSGVKVSWVSFARAGIPLTAFNLFVYWVWFRLFYS